MVSDERGQLILVGAIAIALVVLGLVLIVNTALFTQVVGSEGTVESAKEGGVTGQEVGNAMGAVIAEENRNGNPVSSTDFEGVERGFRNQSLESTGSFVSLEYLTDNENGTLIEQSGGPLIDKDNNPDWDPVTNGDIGEFLLTLDTVSSDPETFTITVDPTGPGSSKTLSVSVNGPNKIELSGGSVSGCSAIDTSDRSVTIDVRHGVVYGAGGCEFDLFSGIEEPFSVEFSGGENMDATYSIATDQTSFSDPDHPGGYSIIWSFEYAFTYDSQDATVESEGRVIDVYD